MSGADRAIRGAAGAAVVALAVIAGAVSYAHMKILAERHGETGWRAHAFPLSVDGIEIVASLVLLADRRVGRRWLVWAALVAGTAANVAANVAVGAPAFALLVATLLLSGLRDGPAAPSPTVTASRTSDVAAADGGPASGSRPRTSAGARDDRADRDASRTAANLDDLGDLLPAARAVQASVAADGQRSTRAVLADRLRRQGVTVSNARLSALRRAWESAPAGQSASDGGER